MRLLSVAAMHASLTKRAQQRSTDPPALTQPKFFTAVRRKGEKRRATKKRVAEKRRALCLLLLLIALMSTQNYAPAWS